MAIRPVLSDWVTYVLLPGITQRLYRTGQARYHSFCQKLHRSPLPQLLLLFVANLANEGLAHSTIKVYLSAIRNHHIATGHHQTFASQLTPRVEQVLQGVKRTQASQSAPRVRLPITIQLMHKIRTELLQEPHIYGNALLWAACCIAFFGFLRCSEFTVPSVHDYDPSAHLSYDDLSTDSRDSPSVIQLHIKQSKTDPFRKGVKLFLAKTGLDICPLRAILPYLVIRGSKSGPLFLTADGSPLTRQRFHTLLSTLLRKIGLPVTHYNTHSFRIGAATSAKDAGISDTHIQMLGRWRSSAYQQYIRTSPTQLAELTRALAHQP